MAQGVVYPPASSLANHHTGDMLRMATDNPAPVDNEEGRLSRVPAVLADLWEVLWLVKRVILHLLLR